MREIASQIRELADPYLQTRKNNIHTDISYGYALKLLQLEPGDSSLVIPAILCHDVGWSKVPEELQRTAFGPNAFDFDLRRVHEVEGVKLARTILQLIHYDPAKTEEILQIIDGHDSRLTALSDSDKLVKDADKLFRFDPAGFRVNLGLLGLGPSPLIQYLEERLEPWFFTASAKRLAAHNLARVKRTFIDGTSYSPLKTAE